MVNIKTDSRKENGTGLTGLNGTKIFTFTTEDTIIPKLISLLEVIFAVCRHLNGSRIDFNDSGEPDLGNN
jgi:hypothetical protein